MLDEKLYFEDVLRIVDIYQSEIDWAVRGQIDAVLVEGDSADDQNHNALRAIRRVLKRLHSDGFLDDFSYEDMIDQFTPTEEREGS